LGDSHGLPPETRGPVELAEATVIDGDLYLR
jgi:hypothetical protein